MTRKIRPAIAAIIFVAVLSLTTFAQSSAWTRMMNQGANNVNDVAVHYYGAIWITKTDGTVWWAQGDNSNFVQVPAPGFAVRIAVSFSYLTFITTNDGRLFYRQFSSNTWQQINTNSFVNDVADSISVDWDGNTQWKRLWISESFYPIASNNSVKYINAKNDVSKKAGPTQIGVVSYLDYDTSLRTFNGSFISTNSSGFSRVAAKYGNRREAWGVGFNGTVWKYVGNSWTRTPAQGMSDITEVAIGKIWLAGQQQYNGTIWCSPDNALTFRQDVGVQGFQNLASDDAQSSFEKIYAAGYNGTLWKRSLSASPCNP